MGHWARLQACPFLTTQMVQEGTQLLSLAALLPDIIELAANNTYGKSCIVALVVMSQLVPPGLSVGLNCRDKVRNGVISCLRRPAFSPRSRRSPGGLLGNVCLLLTSS